VSRSSITSGALVGKYFPFLYQTVPTGGGAPIGSTSLSFSALAGAFVFVVLAVAVAVRIPYVKKIVKE